MGRWPARPSISAIRLSRGLPARNGSSGCPETWPVRSDVWELLLAREGASLCARRNSRYFGVQANAVVTAGYLLSLRPSRLAVLF